MVAVLREKLCLTICRGLGGRGRLGTELCRMNGIYQAEKRVKGVPAVRQVQWPRGWESWHTWGLL